MQGFVTKKGAVFTTSLRIVQRKHSLRCEPPIIAEPGDLINVEGSLLRNLSRAAIGDPRVCYPLDGAVFVLPKAS